MSFDTDHSTTDDSHQAAMRTSGGYHPLRPLAALLTSAPMLALAFVASASAAPPNFCPPGAGAGRCNSPQAVAVDQSSGAVYLGEGNNHRVDEFDSEGHFIRAFGLGIVNGADEPQVCTTACIQGLANLSGSVNPDAIAVDNSIGPSQGAVYVANPQNGRVEEFSEAGTLLNSFSACATSPCPLVVDSFGHLWAGAENRLLEYGEGGEALGEVSLPGFGEVSSLAIDGAGDFYALAHSVNGEQVFAIPANGNYELCFEGSCATLPFDAPGEEVKEALEALPTIGVGDVSVIASGTFGTVIFEGALAATHVPLMTDSAGPVTVFDSREGAPAKLEKFGPAGKPLLSFDAGGRPDALALDPASGDLFAADQPQGTFGQPEGHAPVTLLKFNLAGEQIEAFGAGEVIGKPRNSALAFGTTAQALYTVSSVSQGESAAQIFALPGPGPLPIVGTSEAKGIAKLAATLCAEVNPENAATKARFQYISAAQFEKNEEEGHEGFNGALLTSESASLGEDFKPHPLCQPISGLTPAAEYRFRLLAHNANGENVGEVASFSARPAAAIDATGASEVTAESATLEAEIDPLGLATEYHFEYIAGEKLLENEENGLPPFTGALQAPLEGASIEPGEEDVLVSQHLQGLSPHAAYRFRAVIRNKVSEEHPAEGQEGDEFAGPARAFSTQSAAVAELPDHRAYEQVSPPEKRGAALLPIAEKTPIQAAASGDRIAYLASAPVEADPAGSFQTQILSARGESGWASRDLDTPHAGPLYGLAPPENPFFSEDLSRALLVHAVGSEPLLSPAASEQTPYLRSDFAPGGSGAFCTESCFRPLVTGCPGEGACPAAVQALADVPTGTEFGSTGQCGPARCGPEFLAASPDLSHVVLRSSVALTGQPLPVGAKGGLYEWSASVPPGEALRLLSVLPGGEVSPGRPWAGSDHSGIATPVAVRHTISANGSRVLWSTEEGHLYLRYNATAEQSAIDVEGNCTESEAACTVQLDRMAGGPGASQPPHAVFQDATPDGSRVFFTDTQQLTPDSGSAAEGDLYECRIVKEGWHLRCQLTDLTPESASGEAANTQGLVIGTSEDGSYVYFVADGVLAHNTVNSGGGPEAAQPGDCVGSSEPSPNRLCSLYLRHGEQTTFLAVVSEADQSSWAGSGSELSELAARVSPNGHWLAFMSQRSLSGYDNRDATSGQRDEEVFLYHAPAAEGEEGKLLCASCNPSGARPHGVEFAETSAANGHLAGGQRDWPETTWLAANVPAWTPADLGLVLHQPRYLSDQGRLFFNSSDALAPSDSNGTEDVYQYEPSQGEESPPNDTCTTTSPTYSPVSRGCLSLISSGVSPEESALLDASENGNDVFFLTALKLAPSDFDTSLDLYDARAPHVPGEQVGSPVHTKPVECLGDACQQPATPPIDATPGSLTFSGPGNQTPPEPAPAKPTPKSTKCAKGKKRVHGKCVNPKKKARKAKKSSRHSKARRASRGAGR